MAAVRVVYAVCSAVGAERVAALRDALVDARVISSDYYRAHAAVAAAPPEHERKTVLHNAGCGLAVSAASPGWRHPVRRFLEFFAATIRSKSTRMAYYRAVTDFFAWLNAAGVVALVDIEPLHVAASLPPTPPPRCAAPSM